MSLQTYYDITPDILSAIASIEYARSVVENTTILPAWQNQLKKEARAKIIHSNLVLANQPADFLTIKQQLDLPTPTKPVSNFVLGLGLVTDNSAADELGEDALKELNRLLTGEIKYRSKKIADKTDPEEILAEIVEVFDWLNSAESRQTHPILRAGILKYFLEHVQPFENFNSASANLMIYLVLASAGYSFKNFFCLEDYYTKTKSRYEHDLAVKNGSEAGLTIWLEYFTEGFSIEAANLKEKVKLLARDTKVAKASGRHTLTSRQERVVEYLQDYGVLQNRDFKTVFADVSEDSILRDLKVLVDKGIVKKSGSTKSSRYELG